MEKISTFTSYRFHASHKLSLRTQFLLLQKKKKDWERIFLLQKITVKCEFKLSFRFKLHCAYFVCKASGGSAHGSKLNIHDIAWETFPHCIVHCTHYDSDGCVNSCHWSAIKVLYVKQNMRHGMNELTVCTWLDGWLAWQVLMVWQVIVSWKYCKKFWTYVKSCAKTIYLMECLSHK